MVENSELEMIHLDLIQSVVHLINAPSQRGWCHFNFEEKFADDDMGNSVRVVDELWTAEWWRLEESKLTTVSKMILAIGIATDETTLTMTNRKLQPIYAFSYNYGEWWRSKESGWMLIGMFPVVRPVVSHAKSAKVRQYRRLVHRWQMGELMASLIDRTHGFYVDIVDANNQVRTEWMYPRFPFGIADEPEMKASFIGAKISSTSSQPCNICSVKPASDTIYVEGEPRDTDSIRNMMPTTPTSDVSVETKSILSTLHSLHWEHNPMWRVPGYDPFSHPGCILHQLDSGVFEIILSRTVEWLRRSNAGPASVQEFDRRWSLLSLLPGGKLFRRGVSFLSNVSMAEHRLMTMGLPFVLHGMTESAFLQDSEDTSVASSGHFLEEVAVTYLCWRWSLSDSLFSVYVMSAIHDYGLKLIRLIESFSRRLNGSEDGEGDLSIKVHKILHWTKWIARYGCPHLWSSETFESAHKLVKQWRGSISWKHDNTPGHRVMNMNAVYNAHAERPDGDLQWRAFARDSRLKLYSLIGMEDIPSGWITHSDSEANDQKNERWGLGMFRGRLETRKLFVLCDDDVRRIMEYENSVDWFDDPVRDTEFIRSLKMTNKPALSCVVELLRRNWSLITQSMDDVSHPKLIRNMDGFVKLFTVTGAYRRDLPHGVLRFWKKCWIDMPSCNKEDRGYYVKCGMFLYYSIRSPQTADETKTRHDLIGRIEWLLSFSDQQVIILRKTDIKKRIGELVDSNNFIARHRARSIAGKALLRNVNEHFRQVTLKNLREGQLTSAYHVIVLGEECKFDIGDIASLQPDFLTENREEDGTSSFKRYYESNYILLWN